MKNWLIAGIVAVVASIASLANAEAPDTLTLNEATMTKLGEGTRRKFVVPLYDIALYISEGQDVETIPTELMNPMALRIEVTSALVSSALFAEALKDGFMKYERYDDISEIVDNYLAQFTEEIVEGDIYTVFSDPVEGVITYRNGEVFIVVDNPTFKDAMFSIWLGERPVNRRLKARLLNQRRRR